MIIFFKIFSFFELKNFWPERGLRNFPKNPRKNIWLSRDPYYLFIAAVGCSDDQTVVVVDGHSLMHLKEDKCNAS